MRTAASVMLVLAMAGMARGQNALDKPLDRSLQKGSGGMNAPRSDYSQELRLRNAIVTGNAPGGLSFRGDVGYRAVGEFFGSLGSNETFSFRRDSYYSGLGGMGIRGTDALQYQFAMTTGNTPPPGFTGLPVLSRSGTSVTGQNAARAGGERVGVPGETTGVSVAKPDPMEPGGDVRGLSLMSLRSPASFMSTRGLGPTAVGRVTGEDGQSVGMTASGLRGISYDADLGVTKKPEQKGVLDALNQSVTDKPLDSKLNEKIDDKAGAPKSSYDDLMMRLKAAGDGNTGDVKDKDGKGGTTDKSSDGRVKAGRTWQEQLDELRKQLGDPKNGREKNPGAPKPGDTPDAKDKKDEGINPATLDVIRGAGTKIEILALPGYDAYASHMKSAQECMAQGQYFFAEERFTAALAIKSGDPMAAIGRVHAQLGASMFLSAGINLRALFTEHPEVSALKYSTELTPPPDRMRTLIERLSEQAEAKDAKRRDSALLMAYLAYQLGDEKIMKRGLEIMATGPETKPGDKVEGPDQLQKLSKMLSGVWMKPDAAVPATVKPASTPTAPTTPPAPTPNK